MKVSGPLDFLPIWAHFLGTVSLVFLAVEGGYRLGRYRRRCVEQEDRPPVGEMVAATLALLAVLLAFTFSIAASRFEVRRELMIDEANAIGTTFLRASFLSEPYRGEVEGLLQEYVAARLEGTQLEKLEEAIARSERIHQGLWARAVAAGRERSESIVVGLFIASLNELIDLHTKRLTLGAGNRIPAVIWGALYFVTFVAMGVMGYHSGLSGSSRSLAVLALVLTFSAVMTMIADLDRPQEGLLRVGQQAMLEVQKMITRP